MADHRESNHPSSLARRAVHRPSSAVDRPSSAVHRPSSAATTWQRSELMLHIRTAAAALKSYFGARRVVLFGSLLDPERFSAESDVDLAVEGLDPWDRWDAWWLCEELIQDRKVDLVPVELAEPSVRHAIDHSGKEL